MIDERDPTEFAAQDFADGEAKQGNRQCGYICHNAKRSHCECICGGRFHGEAGKAARQEVIELLGTEVYLAGLKSAEDLEDLMARLDDEREAREVE